MPKRQHFALWSTQTLGYSIIHPNCSPLPLLIHTHTDTLAIRNIIYYYWIIEWAKETSSALLAYPYIDTATHTHRDTYRHIHIYSHSHAYTLINMYACAEAAKFIMHCGCRCFSLNLSPLSLPTSVAANEASCVWWPRPGPLFTHMSHTWISALQSLSSQLGDWAVHWTNAAWNGAKLAFQKIPFH